MKFTYKLQQIHPQIFILEVNTIYDLGMIFLRAQEFYESANSAFRGKNFSLLSYMDWYAKKYSEDQEFTYSNDFRGYNVPSSAIDQCYSVNTERTVYDEFMMQIYDDIAINVGARNFYLLGVTGEDMDALDHEIAHALFYIDPKYRETMTQLVEMLPFKDELFEKLEKIFAYAKEVHVDETQAYLATGLVEEFGEDRVKVYEQYVDPFKQVFAEWRKEISDPVTILHRDVDFFDNLHI